MSIEEAFVRLPELSTARLKIRQIQARDSEAIFRIKRNREVTQMYGVEPDESIEKTRKWVEERISNYKDRNVLYWVFTLTGEDQPIGSICLWHLDLESRCAEVGYELNSMYWKHGYMFEALWATINYSFEIGFHRIEACPFEINEPSKKLLLKLGFRHEGTLRDRCFYKGEYMHQMYFGLLKEEWIRRKEHFVAHS